jgi:hypothetical protein
VWQAAPPPLLASYRFLLCLLPPLRSPIRCRDGVRDLLKQWFIEHEDRDFPCLHNDLDYSGAVHEVIDGTVPIYTAELQALAFFHNDAAMAALSERFGADALSGAWPSGPFAAGLHCLIQQGVSDWYADDAESLWDSWLEALDSPELRRAALAKVAESDYLDNTPLTLHSNSVYFP